MEAIASKGEIVSRRYDVPAFTQEELQFITALSFEKLTNEIAAVKKGNLTMKDSQWEIAQQIYLKTVSFNRKLKKVKP